MANNLSTRKEIIFKTLQAEPYANFLGFKLISAEDGCAVAEVMPTENMLNSHGTVHGGVIFSIADFVFAAASNSYGQIAVGVNNNINYLSAAFPNKLLRAEAKEVRRTRKLAWYSIKVFSEDELVATMEAMVYVKSEYFVKE
ncbi:PaaI family thioesterase [Lysinibacillus endophyticus]|uniref:PaaI family thioesterase n=1 Tax=Ureibacillus endophyticus TaxID=1978490 RepID=A0A494Z4U7_9BACL|nr:PaaI family thioesterase [Lysinibacillus endophyticus]MCP1146244.1 PaaI family thioesterase [Lysinibacillus endophyticus]RKQ17033.1 PaaI family thioesterase [Lysinibacillus endophyticus]